MDPFQATLNPKPKQNRSKSWTWLARSGCALTEQLGKWTACVEMKGSGFLIASCKDSMRDLYEGLRFRARGLFWV